MIRTLWATAALLAIVAMHGLAAHAGSPDPAALPAVPAAHSAHAAVALDDSRSSALAGPASTASHGEHGHEMGVVGLCAALLATSAILLLVGFGRPRSGVLGLLPRAVTSTSYAARARLEHPPPDLHALSVLRC